MFSHKVMDSDLARALSTKLHDRQVEISLIDSSDVPVASGHDAKSNRCVMTHKYLQFAERIRNFTVYEDDVWVITFPKSGTTWTQEMVWLILHDLDYEAARKTILTERTVFLETSAVIHNYPADSIEAAENLPRPRHIKSHMPLAMLPKQLWTVKPKIVYCTRNPKDTAISYMHHYRHLHGYEGSNETFLDGLLADQVLWCPQIQHTLDFWYIRDKDNLLINHFEEMSKDLMSVLKRTCKFFNKSYTDAQLTELEAHLSFDAMKANPSTNHDQFLEALGKLRNEKIDFKFLRKGQVGSYKKEMPANYITRFQERTDKQLAGTGFSFME